MLEILKGKYNEFKNELTLSELRLEENFVLGLLHDCSCQGLENVKLALDIVSQIARLNKSTELIDTDLKNLLLQKRHPELIRDFHRLFYEALSENGDENEPSLISNSNLKKLASIVYVIEINKVEFYDV